MDFKEGPQFPRVTLAGVGATEGAWGSGVLVGGAGGSQQERAGPPVSVCPGARPLSHSQVPESGLARAASFPCPRQGLCGSAGPSPLPTCTARSCSGIGPGLPLPELPAYATSPHGVQKGSSSSLCGLPLKSLTLLIDLIHKAVHDPSVRPISQHSPLLPGTPAPHFPGHTVLPMTSGPLHRLPSRDCSSFLSSSSV